MKNILTGNDAIEAYEEIQASYSIDNYPKKCGYFISDDCYITKSEYDNGSILAFDSTSGDCYELDFKTAEAAINWINQ